MLISNKFYVEGDVLYVVISRCNQDITLQLDSDKLDEIVKLKRIYWVKNRAIAVTEERHCALMKYLFGSEGIKAWFINKNDKYNYRNQNVIAGMTNQYEIIDDFVEMEVFGKGIRHTTRFNKRHLEKAKSLNKTWYVKYISEGKYVCCNIKSKTIFLHRVIKDNPEGYVIDHINGDTLNNLDSNLRKCSIKENSRNRKKQKGETSSPYKGVGVDSQVGNFNMSISINEKRYDKVFTNEVAAANAYNYYAKKYYGQYALLNDVEYMPKEEWVKYLHKFTSDYKGIHWDSNKGKWVAQIYYNKKQHYIGQFTSEEDAVKAYNEVAKK